ncbi:MAG: aspartate kinase, partial [Flavobacteriales bacterium]|nr:aspartate kinase [Flavobacteriales bacterium]
ARSMQEEIEEFIGSTVKLGAIVMALKRLQPKLTPKMEEKIREVIFDIKDLTVRSDMIIRTFQNSATLVENQMKLMEEIKNIGTEFYIFSHGVHESTIATGKSSEKMISDIFSRERLLIGIDNLSAITARIDSNYLDLPGLYYSLLKAISWEGINLVEIISTTNEFTCVVDQRDINRAFTVLNDMRMGR